MSTNPENKDVIERKPEYAGFLKRFAAFFIDVILLCFISWGGANIVYFIGMWAWKGQTLGQMIANVKVVRIDGKPVDLRTSAIRFIGYLICGLTLGLGFLIIAFDKNKQGLHDKLAETYVINV